MPATAYERGGDEPALLARSVPGVTVLVDPDRHAAGTWAERELDPDVFILDDGYQHLQLARDLNVLVVDGTDPFGDNEMAPFGRLREPLQGVKRADAVIVTRADRPVDEGLIHRVVHSLGREGVPIYYAYHDVTGLRPLAGGDALPPSAFRNRRVAVLAALGNPGVLLGDLEHLGIDVASETLHRDHHDYSQADVDLAVAAARERGAEAILTTAKDAVKLVALDTTGFPFFVVEIEFRSEHEALIKSLALKAILKHKSAAT